MSECDCRIPRPHPKPEKRGWCRCGLRLGEGWESNDHNLDTFFNYLNSCQNVPATIAEFEALCERRERHGRDHFGFAYLDRDNIAEAAEEAADLLLYMYLHQLGAERKGDADEGRDLAYTAAFHAAQAYDALVRLKSKRSGSP